MSLEQLKGCIERGHSAISLARQCELLGFSRAALYYRPVAVSDDDLTLMRLMDEEYLKHPFYGSRRFSIWLCEQGYEVGRDKARSLMRLMGLEAIYPKPRLSLGNKEHKKYPYLLSGLEIVRPDQVWCGDITYIRLKRSFAYLCVVMDWYSRYVLNWEVSLSLESDFCLRVLERSLSEGKPQIFNSDQGVQYTSKEHVKLLQDAGVQISMDGRGRAFDNIIQERLWRTVKYEDIFIHEYADHLRLREGLTEYFEFYNGERRHTSLDRLTPHEVYREGLIPYAVVA